MATFVAQPNFSKGEVSSEIRARFDTEAYPSGVRQARNVHVVRYGGLRKRMGTRLVHEVANATKPVRLIPFQFSIDQAYALEFGQGYMRPHAFGGAVLEQSLAITDISAAAQAVLTVAYHGYEVGDEIYLIGGGGFGPMAAMLNNRFWRVIAVLDDNRFRIDADTRGLTFEGWNGGITRTAPPDPPEPPPVVPPPVDPPAPPKTGDPIGGGGGTQYDPDWPRVVIP